MERDELIDAINKYLDQTHIALIDVEYGDSPRNPAYLMREAKKMIKELDFKHTQIYNEYANVFAYNNSCSMRSLYTI